MAGQVFPDLPKADIAISDVSIAAAHPLQTAPSVEAVLVEIWWEACMS